MRTAAISVLALAMAAGFPGGPASARQVTEAKKIDAPGKLKPGEGALRLSVRTQTQSTETLFVYFIEVRQDGSDGERILRFERGAGVPIMGSNMIDPKPQVYRVAAGRYRPLAFTLKCDGVPFEGAVCSSNIGGLWPTGYYARSEPFLAVEAGKFTDAGDFVVEYKGPIPDPRANIMSVKKQAIDYVLRWRALPPAELIAFKTLPSTEPVQAPPNFHSRITCDQRPAGTSLYIPFAC